MSCGLFDLACHAQGAVDGLVTWVLSFFSFNTMVMLWIGTAIGAKWGWKALIAETLGIFLILRRTNPEAIDPDHEHVEGNDAAPTFPSRKPKVRKPVPSKGKPSLIERLTGRPE